MGRPLSCDERRSTPVSVRAELGIGQVGRIEHHVRRIGNHDAFPFAYSVLGRQHVVDARPRWRLKDTLGEGVGDETLDFFAALSSRAQFRHFQDAREMRARTLGVHATRAVRGRHRMIDDGGEAVLAVPYLHVTGSFEYVDRGLVRHERWARVSARAISRCRSICAGSWFGPGCTAWAMVDALAVSWTVSVNRQARTIALLTTPFLSIRAMAASKLAGAGPGAAQRSQSISMAKTLERPSSGHFLASSLLENSLLCLARLIVPMGILSDRVGRRPVLMAATGGLFVLAFPLFWMLHHTEIVAARASRAIVSMSSALDAAIKSIWRR